MTSSAKGTIPKIILLTSVLAAACTTAAEKETPQQISSPLPVLEHVSLSKNDCENGEIKTGLITELYNQGNKAHLMDIASANMPAGTTVIHMLNYYTLGAINEHICKGGANEFKPKEAIIPLNPN